MSITDILSLEYPSLVLGGAIAIISGFLFAIVHDLTKHIVSPWLRKKVLVLLERLSRDSS